MARFAEALLPAIHAADEGGVEEAKAVVARIPDLFRTAWLARMRAKLGLEEAFEGEGALVDALFAELERHAVDFTGFFRALASLLRGDGGPLAALLPEPDAMAPWIADWWGAIEREGRSEEPTSELQS